MISFTYEYVSFQVFARADIYTRVNESEIFEKVEEFYPKPDRIFENARLVSIKLNKIIAKDIQIEIFFSQNWIMISEVTFDSSRFTKLELCNIWEHFRYYYYYYNMIAYKLFTRR